MPAPCLSIRIRDRKVLRGRQDRRGLKVPKARPVHKVRRDRRDLQGRRARWDSKDLLGRRVRWGHKGLWGSKVRKASRGRKVCQVLEAIKDRVVESGPKENEAPKDRPDRAGRRGSGGREASSSRRKISTKCMPIKRLRRARRLCSIRSATRPKTSSSAGPARWPILAMCRSPRMKLPISRAPCCVPAGCAELRTGRPPRSRALRPRLTAWWRSRLLAICWTEPASQCKRAVRYAHEYR